MHIFAAPELDGGAIQHLRLAVFTEAQVIACQVAAFVAIGAVQISGQVGAVYPFEICCRPASVSWFEALMVVIAKLLTLGVDNKMIQSVGFSFETVIEIAVHQLFVLGIDPVESALYMSD